MTKIPDFGTAESRIIMTGPGEDLRAIADVEPAGDGLHPGTTRPAPCAVQHRCMAAGPGRRMFRTRVRAYHGSAGCVAIRLPVPAHHVPGARQTPDMN